MDKKIGFLGTGQMATALAVGINRSNLVSPSNLFGYDVLPDAAARFAEKTGGSSLNSIRDIVSRSDVVFLAVKPQQMKTVLKEIKGTAQDALSPLWISIAAGISLSTCLKELGETARVVRVMPNAPALVGEGVSGYCMSPGVTSSDAESVVSLLRAVGPAYQVQESQLDAVVGVSGSGPAYVFMMIEALADGGVKMGLPRDLALELAAQTVFGSGKMALQTHEHPGVLKDRICSPKGTTICAVHALEQKGFRAAVIDAVEAATRRSIELASES